MIICNEWGLHLRWGNYGIAYLALMSFCLETGHELCLPDYYAWKYLKHPPKIVSRDLRFDVKLSLPRYTPAEIAKLLNDLKANPDKVFDVDIGSFCNIQSENWWTADKKAVFKGLELTEEAVQRVREKYSSLFSEKPLIGIGIRRGDFVNHGVFYQIPTTWYEHALQTVFPDWESTSTVVVLSDNINECKTLLNPQFCFAEHNTTYSHEKNFTLYHADAMDHFILGCMCSHFIGGSSTFHWLIMQYISVFGGQSKLVHSGKNLSDKGQLEFGKKEDYYPQSWIQVEINQKMSLVSLADNTLTDKNTAHSYLPLYDELFANKRYCAKNVLEVGVEYGGSIKLWMDYFSNAQIYGVDVVKRGTFNQWDTFLSNPRVTIYDGANAYDTQFFNENIKHKTFDVLIDDGPHTIESMKTFITLYSSVLATDGILFVEDIPVLDWTNVLKECVPHNLKEFVKVYDLRSKKGRWDDIVFTIDCRNHRTT